MRNSAGNKKKAFFIFAILFFIFGGALSLFFISGGIEDIKGEEASKKGFRYGFNFRKSAVPLFDYLGFTKGEDESEDRGKIGIVSSEEFSKLQKSALAASGASESGSSAKVSSRRGLKKRFSSSRKRIPKMTSRRRSLGLGRASSRSSAGLSEFSRRGLKDDVKIMETGGVADSGEDARKNALSSIRKTENLLAQTHGINSALGAKSKWDRGFVGGLSGAGGRDKLSYGNNVAELDKIESSVLSLKEIKRGAFDIPDVGAPKQDSSGAGADSALKKIKNAANPLAGLLNQMMKPLGNALASGMKSAASGPESFEIPDDVREYVNEFRQEGEKATLTKISCGEGGYCDDSGIKDGVYYRVIYEGKGDYGPFSDIVANGEDGMFSVYPEGDD